MSRYDRILLEAGATHFTILRPSRIAPPSHPQPAVSHQTESPHSLRQLHSIGDWTPSSIPPASRSAREGVTSGALQSPPMPEAAGGPLHRSPRQIIINMPRTDPAGRGGLVGPMPGFTSTRKGTSHVSPLAHRWYFGACARCGSCARAVRSRSGHRAAASRDAPGARPQDAQSNSCQC